MLDAVEDGVLPRVVEPVELIVVAAVDEPEVDADVVPVLVTVVVAPG